jgi:5-formyltetrahydrofolate cyclo-ligase
MHFLLENAIMNANKKSLREKSLSARSRIGHDEAGAAALALAGHLLAAIPVSAATVAGYRPIRGEIDPAGAFPELLERGHRLCLPVVEATDAPLIFKSWQPGEPLEKSRYGIEAPHARAQIVTPEALIVPLVAFDAAGHRLGYGAGYYDRTIRALREAGKTVQIIGVAFSVQQVDFIPPDGHDEKLDMIVTQKGILKLHG